MHGNQFKIPFGLGIAIVFSILGLFFGSYILFFSTLIALAVTFFGPTIALLFVIFGFSFCSEAPIMGMVVLSILIGCGIFILSPFSFWEILGGLIRRLARRES